ncbi:hypothetical protein ACHAWU_002996 [Discostella pseudostelligera]|uniref:Uncharacterized protein n=1 Tax=Discostella pseudostelligera TaxID=259834 RepID=A0ABD3M5E3_9STRA
MVLRTNIVSSVAYAECGGLRLRVDSSVTSIPDSSELNLKCLAKVELPEDLQALRVKYLFEGLLKIGEDEFSVCTTSKSIVVPSAVTAICDGTFHTCTSLEEVRDLREGILTISRDGLFANFAEVNCTFDMLRRRFDDLPIHELCHTVTSNEELQTLMEVIQLHSAHGFPVDCLGTTPLHILACSGNRNILLYRCYLECFPDAIIDEDNWGETPLGYIVFSGNSEEILHIFMETCKKRWGVLPFDIGNIMLKKFISAERARRFIQALRRYFPDLVIDWQEIVEQSISREVPLRVFGVLVEASVSSRNNCMSTDHRIEIDQWIAEYEEFLGTMNSIHMGPFYEELRTLVIQFTQEHREFLLIVSTMLELALWKAVLNESLLENNDRTIRSDLRVNAGQMFQVAIPNVLSFL